MAAPSMTAPSMAPTLARSAVPVLLDPLIPLAEVLRMLVPMVGLVLGLVLALRSDVAPGTVLAVPPATPLSSVGPIRT